MNKPNHLFLFALSLALLLVVLSSAIASAHSNLVKSDPAAGAVLGQAPTEVKLWYDAAVDIGFSQVQVLDQNRTRVDQGTLKYLTDDHKAITAPLKPLSDGTYTVEWRVLSEVDGHTTDGVFAFSVGTPSGAPVSAVAPTSNSVAEASPVSVVTRWLNLLATLTFVGGLFFRIALLDRSVRAANLPENALLKPWQRLTDGAFIVALASACVGLVLEASTVANVSVADALAVAPLTRTLFNTNYGILWLVRNGLILLTDVIFLLPSPRARQILPSALGAVALATYSLGSHDAAVAGMWSAPVLADWFHLLSVAVWAGGLVHFSLVVWRAPSLIDDDARAKWIAWLVPQFSTLAIVSTAVLAFTGLISALLQVVTFDALLQTFYGQTLTLKVLVFFAMIGFGAINLLWLSPRFHRTQHAPDESHKIFARFRVTVTGEVMLATGAILLASLLTLLPPARIPPTQNVPTNIAQATYLEAFLADPSTPNADKVHVELTLRPDFTNPTDYDVKITDARTNAALDDILRVIFEFTYMDRDTGIAKMDATPRLAGHYSVSGDQTPLDGFWLVQIVVRRKGLEDATATFPILRGKPTITNDPKALALLKASDDAMNTLTTMNSQQLLNDGSNGVLVTNYQYQAPDKMRFEVVGETTSIAIGKDQYYQSLDGTWSEQARIEPLVFPNFTNAKDAIAASFGRVDILNNVPMQIVRFRIAAASGTPIDYAGWINPDDKRLEQFAMVTTSHFMMQYYNDFNGTDIAIATPTNVATPTPAPVSSNAPAPALKPPARIPGPITGDLEADVALGVMVVGILAGLVSSDRKRSRRWRLSVLATSLVLIGAAIYLFVDAVNAQQALANAPVDVSAANVGKSIYEANCAACHGEAGHGDGPAGKSLPVQPFDLTTHVLLHDEQYLEAVVANGRGYMPAWKDKLSPLQIQEVIQYARQLAFQARAANGTPTPAPGFTP